MISVVIVTFWWTLGFNCTVSGWAAGDTRGVLRGCGHRRGRILPADALYNDTTVVAHHLPHLVLQILASLVVFDQIYIMNTSGGLNYTATRPVIQYIYEQGFT